MTIEAKLSTYVRASLKVFGYELLPGSCEDDYRFKLVIASGTSYRAQIVTHDDTQVATLAVFLTDAPLYHVSYRKLVYELAYRMSEVVVFGGIAIQVESGAVIFKNAFDANAINPSVPAISRWLNQSAFPLSVFRRAYSKILDGTEAYPALQAALIEGNSSARTVVSKATRRALMEVSKATDKKSHIEKNVHTLCEELERIKSVELKLVKD
jgi:hypothetical protein